MLKKSLLVLAIILIMEVALTAAVKETALKNGIDFVYKYIPGVKVTSVQVWMKTGSVNETPEINGISHFLEHLVFKGTAKFKPDEIDLVVESNGGQMNAATSKDYTFYYITIPTYKSKVAFEVLSEMVFNATFLKDEIDKERPVVIQEIKRKYDNPTFEMWKYISDVLYANTPYSMEIIGTEENIRNFTRNQIVDYYNQYYHPKNMTLVVVGDIPYEEAKILAVEYFEKYREVNSGKSFYLDKPIKINTDDFKLFKKDLTQTYAAIVYPSFRITDKRNYTLDVLTEILSSGENSILKSKLKNELNLVTSIHAGSMGQKFVGSFVIYFTSDDNNFNKVIVETDKILQNIINGIIDDKMLVRAKNRLKSQIVFQREKTSSEANDIGYSFTLGIKDYYFNYIDKINSVTLEDLKSVAKEIFNNHRIIVATSKSELIL